jgi:hypothetical protein
MRRFAVVLVVPFLACGAPGQSADQPDAQVSDGGLPPPTRGFQIKSPTIDIDPGKEVTYCYYFHTPNTVDMSIKQWVSHMTPGSHHMILYLTPTDQQTPGTLSTSQCGITNASTGPLWTYSAQTADAEALLPADDGTGTPVGQMISAGHSGFVQMHYLNATDSVLHAHVELNAIAYDDGVHVTPAGPFVTFNRRIDLKPATPAGPTPGMVNGDCTVSPDSKFYVMTTHTHKQGVHTFVKDGSTVLFDSTSWEHPGTATWGLPFYSFTSGKLSYQCEFLNPTMNEIITGDSAATDEMCMAIGYYFPADGGSGHFCLNSMMLY